MYCALRDGRTRDCHGDIVDRIAVRQFQQTLSAAAVSSKLRNLQAFVEVHGLSSSSSSSSICSGGHGEDEVGRGSVISQRHRYTRVLSMENVYTVSEH